jgi:triphosphatase
VQEIELKCQIPAAALEAVRAQVLAAGQATGASWLTQRLQARYFDTPSRQLAQARAALRLRREGNVWVQTLKALATNPGATHLHRLEHNAPVLAGELGAALGSGLGGGLGGGLGESTDAGTAVSADEVPALHLGRHLGTPAGAALAAALGVPLAEFEARALAGDTLGLAPTFETDIGRTQATISAGEPLTAHAARIELALDEGEVRAAGRIQTLSELELELCAGPVAALIAQAKTWVAQHGLWLDVRSKAERGERLARGELLPAPQPVPRPTLRADAPPAQALREAVAAVLNPLLALGSVVADPALTAQLTPEHLRHWHRGLGLLHQALAQAAEPALVGLDAAPPAGLQASWAPELLLLLAPLDAAGPSNVALWARTARSARCQLLLLEVLGWVAAAA